MSEGLFTSADLVPPIVQVPVVVPEKSAGPVSTRKAVPVCGVPIVSRQSFASRDGRDEEEVIQWLDGSTLQMHRHGMGNPGRESGLISP